MRMYLYQNAMRVDSPQRKATQYFCQQNKTLLCCFLPWWLKITRIFPSPFFFIYIYLWTSQKRKRQKGNIELANRLWQCCFSEVWVTLEKRRVCRWKIQSRCESGMQRNPTDAEWIILTLWLGQIISGLLLCRAWSDAKEERTWRRKTRSHYLSVGEGRARRWWGWALRAVGYLCGNVWMSVSVFFHNIIC